MATQAEVLESVKVKGFYSADLYRFGRSIRGDCEVSPAKRLAEKGVLTLKDQWSETTPGGCLVVHFTWVLSAGSQSPDRPFC
jgi:hypothetical protein